MCSRGCFPVNGKCKSIQSDIVCEPFIDLKSCPYSCNYDKNMNKCIPSGPDSVCEFIKERLVCPYGCYYEANLKKCISTRPEYVCEL